MRTRIEHILLLLLLGSLSSLTPASQAEAVSEHIKVSGHPLRQYILVSTGRESRLTRANLEQLSDGYAVSAEIELSEDALVAAVLELDNGDVVSSALRAQGDDLLLRRSADLTQARVAGLEKQKSELQAQSEELEQGIAKLNSELRVKAGMDDVDRIYQKVEELERDINRLRAVAN